MILLIENFISNQHQYIIVLKTFQYRIYPTQSQTTTMNQTLETCRWIYNETLAYRKDTWEEKHENISLFDTTKLISIWKNDHPGLKQVYSQVLQNCQVRVDLAFKAFFRRVKSGDAPGYPRFKGKGRYDSFTYPQTGFKIVDGKLHLSKIGDIKIKLHRVIDGEIKTLTIKRSANSKWFASFVADIGDVISSRNDHSVVGIDVGISSFATLSNGDKIDNPRIYKVEEKNLARAQRKFSATTKGSIERRKRLKVVQRVHERIANKRKDFIHKVSRHLVDTYRYIVFEDLAITNMLKNHHLAKAISDASWGMLINITTSKAVEAGSEVILVDPRNTSQMCSRCGTIVKKNLSVRIHKCPNCGLVMDRDENAAINILRLGLQSQGIAQKAPMLRCGE